MKHAIYTHALFDWDGCLVHTLPLWLRSYQFAFDTFDLHISDEEIISRGVYNFEAVIAGHIKEADIFGERMYEYYTANLHQVQFHDEARVTLQALRKKHVSIAIVTSTIRETFDAQCKLLKCADLFDATVTWDDTQNHKPHPEPVQKAMKLIGAQKENTLMVGDAHTDIMAAQNAGITPVWFDCHHNATYLNKEHYKNIQRFLTISSLPELLKLCSSS